MSSPLIALAPILNTPPAHDFWSDTFSGALDVALMHLWRHGEYDSLAAILRTYRITCVLIGTHN
jgi:hypothetical protein